MDKAMRESGMASAKVMATGKAYSVTLQDGCTEYHFDFHTASNTWRLGLVSTYGNYGGVYGNGMDTGCDASGFRIRLPEVIAKLNALLVQGLPLEGRRFCINAK